MRRLWHGSLVGTAVLVGSLLATSPAHADNLGDAVGGDAEGAELTARAVHLSGNGYQGTSGGSGGGTVTVPVPMPCYWDVMESATGDWGYENIVQEWDDEYGGPPPTSPLSGNFVFPPKEEIASHRGEDGAWAFPTLDTSFDIETTDECMDAIFAANGGAQMIWVPAGQEPPAPPVPIPPEVLADVAEENLTIPAPGIDANPVGLSFVNLPTWFWVEDGPSEADGFVTLEVTATAGDNSATVVAEPSRLSVQSNGGPTASCTPEQARTPWAAGVDESSACTLTHGRSSATMDGLAYTVTATASYSASWSGVEGGTPVAGEDLGTVTSPTASISVPVAEVQTLVTD